MLELFFTRKYFAYIFLRSKIFSLPVSLELSSNEITTFRYETVFWFETQ